MENELIKKETYEVLEESDQILEAGNPDVGKPCITCGFYKKKYRVIPFVTFVDGVSTPIIVYECDDCENMEFLRKQENIKYWEEKRKWENGEE